LSDAVGAAPRETAPQEIGLAMAKWGWMKGSQHRYGLLLVALSAAFFFEGLAKPGHVQRAVITVLVGATLMLALNAAEVRESLLRVAGAVVLAIVAGVVIATAVGKGSTVEGISAIANGLLVALAPPAVVIGVWRNLRDTGAVTITAISGALCLYLLVGLFFAFTYVAIQNLGGAPFFSNGDAATSARSVYFSFVTLTTVGYGDFTGRTNLGHTLSVTEALIGQIYLSRSSRCSSVASHHAPNPPHDGQARSAVRGWVPWWRQSSTLG
jgi:hypothetical protein